MRNNLNSAVSSIKKILYTEKKEKNLGESINLKSF